MLFSVDKSVYQRFHVQFNIGYLQIDKRELSKPSSTQKRTHTRFHIYQARGKALVSFPVHDVVAQIISFHGASSIRCTALHTLHHKVDIVLYTTDRADVTSKYKPSFFFQRNIAHFASLSHASHHHHAISDVSLLHSRNFLCKPITHSFTAETLEKSSHFATTLVS